MDQSQIVIAVILARWIHTAITIGALALMLGYGIKRVERRFNALDKRLDALAKSIENKEKME